MADLNTLMEAMRERAESLGTLGYTVRFELTDSKQSIRLAAAHAPATVEEGEGEADAVLKLSSNTLEKLIAGQLGPMLAFSTGRLKVEGSRGVALKLASLLGGDD